MGKKIFSDENSFDRVQITSECMNNFFGDNPSIFIWSLIKNEKNENLFFTDTAEEITGYSADELRLFPGKVNTIVFEEDKHRIKRIFNEFCENHSRNDISLIYRIVTKDNLVKWVEERIKVFRNETGAIKEFCGMVSDISRFKESESDLLEKIGSLQQLNTSKDRFIPCFLMI